MLDLLALVVPTYGEDIAALMGISSGFFAGGALIVGLGWVIGYAVESVWAWLDSWTR